jgi:hypothetical protein
MLIARLKSEIILLPLPTLSQPAGMVTRNNQSGACYTRATF